MKNKPKCPHCSSQKTRKRGTRRGKNRYQCQECCHWFQINHSAEKIPSKKLLVQHLSGIPFRGLSDIHGCGVATAYRKVKKHDRKIPVIYGVDYKTHDIPHFRLAKTEDYLNCKKFFESLKLTDYGLQAIVCDDNQNIYNAAKYVFPNVVIQLCHIHFLRNTKSLLDLENNQYHQIFFPVLSKLLVEKRSKLDFEKKAANLVRQFSKDEVCSGILIELARKQSLLQGYLHHTGTPTTTNLIESMNSHLEARLRPLKGFESFKHAELWLNGYFLRRRTKKFTDFSGKFRRLNGKTSLEITKKPGIDMPVFF